MTDRLIGVSLVALVCSACYPAKKPVASTPTNNPNIAVETLFTHDGCTVFRFFDSFYHYYARCDGAPPSATTISSVECGRGCTREDEIKTDVTTAAPAAGPPAPK